MKRKVLKRVKKTAPKQSQEQSQERLKAEVHNWDQVAAFLANLSEQVASVPTLSAEIVKGCVVVGGFLKNRAAAARAQFPNLFVEETKPDDSKKPEKNGK